MAENVLMQKSVEINTSVQAISHCMINANCINIHIGILLTLKECECEVQQKCPLNLAIYKMHSQDCRLHSALSIWSFTQCTLKLAI
jgi:hypothetical protein